MCKFPERRSRLTGLPPKFTAVDSYAAWDAAGDWQVDPEPLGCPNCTGPVQFCSDLGHVARRACGWQIRLAPDDSFEPSKAPAGLSDIPANVLLQMLV